MCAAAQFHGIIGVPTVDGTVEQVKRELRRAAALGNVQRTISSLAKVQGFDHMSDEVRAVVDAWLAAGGLRKRQVEGARAEQG